MKQLTRVAFGSVIMAGLITAVFGQGGDLEKIASKFIPQGSESAHKAVQGRFAESASKSASGNIVVLYKSESDGRSYEGLILASQGSVSYQPHKLPEPEATWSMMEPIAIFFANADGDSENELFIIDECYTGIGPEGAKPFYRTRVYDWNGIAFSHVEPVSDKMGNVRTVATARAKLRQLSKTLTKKTEMQQAVDFGSHNSAIDKAASAGEAWVKEPARVIARTFGGFSEMRSKTVEFAAPTADGADTLTVTIISDGYMDDSVRGEKFRLELKANEQGVWRFTSAGKSWRCQPGRGHQEFSTIRCS